MKHNRTTLWGVLSGLALVLAPVFPPYTVAFKILTAIGGVSAAMLGVEAADRKAVE